MSSSQKQGKTKKTNKDVAEQLFSPTKKTKKNQPTEETTKSIKVSIGRVHYDNYLLSKNNEKKSEEKEEAMVDHQTAVTDQPQKTEMPTSSAEKSHLKEPNKGAENESRDDKKDVTEKSAEKQKKGEQFQDNYLQFLEKKGNDEEKEETAVNTDQSQDETMITFKFRKTELKGYLEDAEKENTSDNIGKETVIKETAEEEKEEKEENKFIKIAVLKSFYDNYIRMVEAQKREELGLEKI